MTLQIEQRSVVLWMQQLVKGDVQNTLAMTHAPAVFLHLQYIEASPLRLASVTIREPP